MQRRYFNHSSASSALILSSPFDSSSTYTKNAQTTTWEINEGELSSHS
jgi:hypothetical protein